MAYVNLGRLRRRAPIRLILNRLHGTPLPPLAHLAGRLGAAVVLGPAPVV